MTAPERIWAWPWEVNPNMGQWETVRAIVGDGTEYILHTRAALAASPLVQVIVAEAVKAERDGRWCSFCRRHEVQADGWCRKCGNMTGQLQDKGE